MISDIYEAILGILPPHNDHPFELASIKGGASVYMFGQRKVLLHQRKDHVKVSVYVDQDTPLDFKAATSNILRADPEFTQSILAAYHRAKENETLETFGCCNSFVACSDALRCLYDNDPYYRGCMYRKNLEAGRVFYGKNKNV